MKKFPKFSLGTWAIGGGDSWGLSDDKESIDTIHAALDLGIEWIDTAPAYGNGRAEEVVGKALKGRRDKVLLASKCGLVWDEEGSMEHMRRDGIVVYRNLTPESIKRQLEASLKRLQTDYLDLYITHHQNPNDSLEETVGCLEELKKEGKIKAYGFSNGNVDTLTSYLQYGAIDCVQEKWSALDRKKDDLLNLTCEKGIRFQAYSPLERGLLSGKVKADDEVIGTAKQRLAWYKAENIQQINKSLEQLKEIASAYSVPLSALILSWQMNYKENMSICVGSRKVFQIEENAKAIDLKLSSADEKVIKDVLFAIKQVE